eukprot:456256_1
MKMIKKDEGTWMNGKEILYRKWEKGMDIEYDSDPQNKKKDGKSHKHTGQLMSVQYDKSNILIKDKNTGGDCSYNVNNIKVKLPPRTDKNYKEPPAKSNTATKYDTNDDHHESKQVANYKECINDEHAMLSVGYDEEKLQNNTFNDDKDV